MNNCSFVGRIVRDPELKTTQSGVSLCNFTIAVDRNFKNDAGEYEVDFLNCTAWRSTAEFVAKWFTKGKPIAVTGSLQIRKYQARDGSDRWASEIQVKEASFVPGEPKREETWHDRAGTTPVTEPDDYLDAPDDDTKLPFDF